jgi:hypothetical protein
MPSPTEHNQLESDLGRLVTEPAGAAPEVFLGVVRARRRGVRVRRVSMVALGAIVVVAGLRLMPNQPPQPDGPRIAEEVAPDDRPGSAPGAERPGTATLASLRHLYTQPSGIDDLLADLPSEPQAGLTTQPLRLGDARRLLAEGV